MPSPRSLVAAFSLLAAAALPAQSVTKDRPAAQPRNTAERLGYPPGTKLLIIHADDIGVAHSVNRATWDAFKSGAITSASIMMPTPWITEVAAYARANPDADLGLHLTLTSEWNTYRWGPLSARESVPSLVDSTGTLWTRETMIREHAKAEDAEREIRAQIALAYKLGIRPTHLDSHMGSLFTRPDLYAVLSKVAHEYGIPFLAMTTPEGRGEQQPALRPGDITLDAVATASDELPKEQWKDWYLKQVKELKPGLTEFIVHVGYDDAELQAVMEGFEPWGSAWRQRDLDVLSSPEFRQALKDNGVTLVTWRELQRRATRP
jgi:chitin disaccharide deacetylase